MEGQTPVVDEGATPVGFTLEEASLGEDGMTEDVAKDMSFDTDVVAVGVGGHIFCRRTTADERRTDVVIADGSHLPLNLLREPHVVLVADGYEVARSPHHGGTEILVETEVVIVDEEMDMGEPRLILTADGGRGVGGAVVLDDKLTDWVRLVQNGINLLADIFFAVVCRHDNGNCRLALSH